MEFPEKNILLVETSEAKRKKIVRLLKNTREKYRVESCDSVETALELIDGIIFSVIFLDLEMPGCSGIDAFIRVHARAPLVPVLALASSEDQQLVRGVIRAGAQECLEKETLTTELIERHQSGFEIQSCPVEAHH